MQIQYVPWCKYNMYLEANTICTLNKYNMYLKQIQYVPWTNTIWTLNKYNMYLDANTICTLMYLDANNYSFQSKFVYQCGGFFREKSSKKNCISWMVSKCLPGKFFVLTCDYLHCLKILYTDGSKCLKVNKGSKKYKSLLNLTTWNLDALVVLADP